MSIEFAGITAYAVELDLLRESLLRSKGPEGGYFTRFYPEALWPQAMAEVREALESGGVVSEIGGCVLVDAVKSTGDEVGFIEAPIEVSAEYPGFARRWFPRILGDEALAERALCAGALGVRGSGRFTLGSLSAEEWRAAAESLRPLAQEEREELDQGGTWFSTWTDDLLSILKAGSDLRALLLVPHYVELLHDEGTHEGTTRPPELRPEEREPGILDVLRTAVSRGATDVLASVGSPLLLRIAGKLEPLEGSPWGQAQVMGFIRPVLTNAQAASLEEGGLVFSFGVKGLARFRVSMARQRTCPVACLRILPFDPPALEALGLPDSLAEIEPGLILVGGAAGSGRTTAVASIVRALLAKHQVFVLTIEEPIEFVHPRGRSATAQIEIGADTPDFDHAATFARGSGADVVVLDHVDSPARLALARELAAAGKRVLATVSGRPSIEGATVVVPLRRA
ncbi:MAG: hypothetical protein HY901_11085 [Deltaproteobacteria bacterium]|nr:hypothetical protein [Deltaproteobacteria bacterium]